MAPKVYVTQEVPLDFTPAEIYGEVKFLTKNDLNNIRGSLHNEQMAHDLSVRLIDFDQEKDFVVIAGSPYVSALVFMLLARKGVRRVKVLRWNNRDFMYIPMVIDMKGSENVG